MNEFYVATVEGARKDSCVSPGWFSVYDGVVYDKVHRSGFRTKAELRRAILDYSADCQWGLEICILQVYKVTEIEEPVDSK
jgi:hypothetical protein